MQQKIITTLKDCPGRLVPVGSATVVPKDSFVTLTQSLGGSYTIVYQGNMIRVDGADAAAIGFEPFFIQYPTRESGPALAQDLWNTMRTIYDPEIPVNIVDLGLIYDVQIKNAVGGTGSIVDVIMTLTAPACGMGPVIIDDIVSRVSRAPNVQSVEVELVFDPPWSREMMSEEAQLQLGLF